MRSECEERKKYNIWRCKIFESVSTWYHSVPKFALKTSTENSPVETGEENGTHGNNDGTM